MRAFSACYSGELKKLCLKKKYIIITIISAFFCLLYAVVSALVGKMADMSTGLLSAGIPLTIMSLFTQLVFPLVIAMAGCDLFASEHQDLSIRAQLMRPVTRLKIFTAKLLAVLTLCGTMFMLVYIFSALADAFIAKQSSDLLYSLGAYILNIIPMLPMLLMVAFINQLTKGSTSAMFLCIIVYIIMKGLGILAPIADSLLFTGYFEWHKLWLGSMLPVGALLSKCILLLGYCVTFFSAGYFLFLKREF